MNLGKSVYNLLKRQKEVYVKGLGSFKQNHTSSTFDEKRNVYLPPINYIDFDKAGLQGYDFIQYIQQLNELDRSEAEVLVHAAVEAVQLKIAADGQVKLDDLGYLVRYGEGYVFKPLDLSGFHFEPAAIWADDIPQAVNPVEEDIVEVALAEEEALSSEETDLAETTAVEEEAVEASATDAIQEEETEPVELVPVSQEAALPEDTEHEAEESLEESIPEAESTAADAAENTLVAEPVSAVLQEEPVLFEESTEQKKGSKAIWYILLVLIALGVMVSLYLANRQVKVPNLPTIADSTPVLVDSIDSASLLLPIDSLMQDSLAVEPVAVDTLVAPVEPEKVSVKHPKHEWQIVIGSHKTLAQAYEQAESYNKAGHPKVRVVPSNLAKNRKKVIWDSYETKEQADSATLYVQKHIIKDAWPDKINK